MKVRIIASDSMGVRSLATVVETDEGVVGIDLGASLAPRRYSLPPHPVELKQLEESLDHAKKWILESDIVVITHYHYDHYIRDEPELYNGKILIIKDPKHNINRSQAIRSYVFLKKLGVEQIAKEVLIGDGNRFKFGKLSITVSSPVWHGYPGTRVGRVLMLLVECCGESMIFTSDVQGPADPEAVEILSRWGEKRPSIIVLGGPPTYFAGFKVPLKHVEAGLRGMEEVIRRVRPEVLVVDHHLLRDRDYLEKISHIVKVAKSMNVRLLTGAEYMGRPLNQLEAMRRELWRGEPEKEE
ncbi:MAG: hypothetical protein GSR81_03730 [Desulfurococcales archaeon]|nr:hypothetical protein [Desulfurococcales archaeon]